MRKAGLLVAASLGWLIAAWVQAAETTQFERCQATLARVVQQPLLTFDIYPDYLLDRHRSDRPIGPAQGLAWCESTLWAQVSRNLEQQPALVRAECSRSQRIPNDYRGLRSYFMGIPNLACEAGWFTELTPEQWKRVQPMLADLNTLEYDCYQGLEALARGGSLRRSQAQSMYNAVMLSRKVFEKRWGTLLEGLNALPREALQDRQAQLAQCESILAEALDGPAAEPESP